MIFYVCMLWRTRRSWWLPVKERFSRWAILEFRFDIWAKFRVWISFLILAGRNWTRSWRVESYQGNNVTLDHFGFVIFSRAHRSRGLFPHGVTCQLSWMCSTSFLSTRFDEGVLTSRLVQSPCVCVCVPRVWQCGIGSLGQMSPCPCPHFVPPPHIYPPPRMFVPPPCVCPPHPTPSKSLLLKILGSMKGLWKHLQKKLAMATLSQQP